MPAASASVRGGGGSVYAGAAASIGAGRFGGAAGARLAFDAKSGAVMPLAIGPSHFLVSKALTKPLWSKAKTLEEVFERVHNGILMWTVLKQVGAVDDDGCATGAPVDFASMSADDQATLSSLDFTVKMTKLLQGFAAPVLKRPPLPPFDIGVLPA